MKYFFVKDGKVEQVGEEGFGPLRGAVPLQEVIKDMTPDQLEAFKKERFEKFIKPLMNHNIQERNEKAVQKEEHGNRILRRKSWRIDPDTRKDK